jgi:hypothetical protein
MKLTFCLLLSCIAGCSLGDDITEIPAEHPTSRVRFIQYGPTRQDVWVVLAEGVQLSTVVDLSVFQPLTPRINSDGAAQLLGHATSEHVDEDNERWFQWRQPRAMLEVGCVRGSSMPDDGSCVWQLSARLHVRNDSSILSPAIQSYVKKAREASSSAVERTLYVEEAGGSKDSLWLTLDHLGTLGGRMKWDRADTSDRTWKPKP